MTQTFFRADLHCHTTCSDGTLTPTEIIDHAIKSNLNGLSITDHDTIQAYKEAMPYAAEMNFLLLPGIEFSTCYKDTSIHVLAYAFSLDAKPIQNLCSKHKIRRENRNLAILQLLAKKSLPISVDELERQRGFFSDSVTRPHIALAMIEKGYVTTMQQAFNEYLSEGKPCFVPGTPISLEETLETIHQAGGLAIIAHPHLINDVRIIRNLIDLPFDGIEGYYARFAPKDNERWIKIAQRKSWVVTGGSDFHGTIKPGTTFGSSWVNEETFYQLYRHFQNSK